MVAVSTPVGNPMHWQGLSGSKRRIDLHVVAKACLCTSLLTNIGGVLPWKDVWNAWILNNLFDISFSVEWTVRCSGLYLKRHGCNVIEWYMLKLQRKTSVSPCANSICALLAFNFFVTCFASCHCQLCRGAWAMYRKCIASVHLQS